MSSSSSLTDISSLSITSSAALASINRIRANKGLCQRYTTFHQTLDTDTNEWTRIKDHVIENTLRAGYFTRMEETGTSVRKWREEYDDLRLVWKKHEKAWFKVLDLHLNLEKLEAEIMGLNEKRRGLYLLRNSLGPNAPQHVTIVIASRSHWYERQVRKTEEKWCKVKYEMESLEESASKYFFTLIEYHAVQLVLEDKAEEEKKLKESEKWIEYWRRAIVDGIDAAAEGLLKEKEDA